MLKFNKRCFASKLGKFPTQLMINNKWVDAVGGETFSTINPSTEQEICQVARAKAADVDLAVKAARHALEKGEWSKFGNSERRDLMNRIANKLEKNAEAIATIESTDNGKPFGMAMYDVKLATDTFKYYAGYTDKIHGQTIPMSGPFMSYTKKVPVGVCGQIIPWNFPLLMASFKLAPVLASGCTTVLKPAENTPLSALKLGELMIEAGLPEGTVNILPGFGTEAGQAIVNHEDIDKIAFTGSTAVGKGILRDSSHTLKRTSLELGGKSPNIILSDADLDLAVGQSHFACYLNSGQYCMAGTRVFVHEDIYDRFVERAVEAAKAKVVGAPWDDKVENGPLISEAQMNKVLKYIKQGKKEGAKLMCGGKRIKREGFFVETTVFADVTDDMTIAKEEIFGPVMSILKFKTLDEALERANNSKYGLASGVVTQSLESAI